jgi:hypothetical protein
MERLAEIFNRSDGAGIEIRHSVRLHEDDQHYGRIRADLSACANYF